MSNNYLIEQREQEERTQILEEKLYELETGEYSYIIGLGYVMCVTVNAIC